MASISIRVLTEDDRDAFNAFLQPRVERSMFLLSNVRLGGLVYEGQRYQGHYVGAFDGHDIVGVVSHFWNGNLNMNAPAHLPELVDAALQASCRPCKGVIGPAEQVQETVDHLGLDVQSEAVKMDESEWLYSLTLDQLIQPAPLVDGVLIGRPLREDDLDTAVKWTVAYRVEAVGDKLDDKLWRDVEQWTRESIKLNNRWMLECAESGEMLAITGFNAMLPEAVQVGGVYTPTALRGRGYAKAVVAASLRDKRSIGAELAILFTGKKNMAAQRAYVSIGFKRIGEYRILMYHN